MRVSRLWLLILLFFLAGGCRKSGTGTSAYTFVNTTDQVVHFNIYKTPEDYMDGRNALQTLRLEAGGRATATLDAVRTYYVDWYSDDYRYNNWWRSDNSSDIPPAPAIAFPVAAQDDIVSITPGERDSTRVILLHGDRSSTTWKAVRNYFGSSGIPYRVVTLRKDFTGEYTYDDSTGKRIIRPFTFLPERFTAPYPMHVNFMRADSPSFFAFMTYNSNLGLTPDSLLMDFIGEAPGLVEYTMVRQ